MIRVWGSEEGGERLMGKSSPDTGANKRLRFTKIAMLQQAFSYTLAYSFVRNISVSFCALVMSALNFSSESVNFCII